MSIAVFSPLHPPPSSCPCTMSLSVTSTQPTQLWAWPFSPVVSRSSSPVCGNSPAATSSVPAVSHPEPRPSFNPLNYHSSIHVLWCFLAVLWYHVPSRNWHSRCVQDGRRTALRSRHFPHRLVHGHILLPVRTASCLRNAPLIHVLVGSPLSGRTSPSLPCSASSLLLSSSSPSESLRQVHLPTKQVSAMYF